MNAKLTFTPFHYVELMSLYTNKIGYNVSNLLPKQNQNLVQILT